MQPWACVVTATRNRERRASDDDVTEAIALIKDSDTVGLKVKLPEDDHRSIFAAPATRPLDVQIRQVFFFDAAGVSSFSAARCS